MSFVLVRQLQIEYEGSLSFHSNRLTTAEDILGRKGQAEIEDNP